VTNRFFFQADFPFV